MDDDTPPPASREDMIEMIAEFMTGNLRVEDLYRSHLCDTLVHRVHEEFGSDGMAELLLKIEARADWILDFVYDADDFHDAMFKRYGIYDDDILFKARSTMAIDEMNSKIINMRKRYINKIVDEIWNCENGVELDV